MKLWRKMANKITVKVTNGFTTLTGRELKRYTNILVLHLNQQAIS